MQKKIRHFVITRFLCSDFGYGDKIKSPEFIAEGIRLLNKFFVPSLLNQTNHNFEVIFAIHNDIPYERIEGLSRIATGDIKTHIVRWGSIDDFIYEQTADEDIVITTRMDYDDLVFSDAVSVIQNLATKASNLEYLWHGYTTGCTLIEDDEKHELHKMVKKYDGDGAWSIFQSLVMFKRKKTSIYCLGNHTEIKRTIRFKNIGFTYKEESFICDHRDMAYVWIRHADTGSHTCKHDTEQLVNIGEEDFCNRFGVSLSTI